ncbi:MAG: hypothetical protein ABSE49_02800 [Polyangiaceae bacterium]|jgi:hypothetical protein
MSRPSHVSKLLAVVAIAAVASCAHVATAQPPPPDAEPPPPDVVLHEAPSPHRALTLEWNPLALYIDRFSINAVIVPGDHHALVLSPFYTWTGTAEFSTSLNANGTPLTNASGNPYVLNVPRQTFTGFGGEIGYRYYLEKGGPRGFFAGPSLILAGLTAKAYNGSQTGFGDIGVAADVGYEALIADKISVMVGGGLQYTFTTENIPPQQLPASIYANERFYPRLLLALGYAF